MAIPAPKGDQAAKDFESYLQRGLDPANVGVGSYARRRVPSGSIAIFWIIFGLIVTAMLYLALFTVGLWYQSDWLKNPAFGGPEGHTQQMLSFWMGMFFVDLALVTDLYRKHFVDDVILVRRRRPKYIPDEDPTKRWDSQWNTPKKNRVTWYTERQRVRPVLKRREDTPK